jgi:hypothetical protein
MPWPCRIPPLARAARSATALLGAGALAAGMMVTGSLAAGTAAQAAARPAWQLARDAHYGPAKNESGYDAVLAHSDEAWFFGGTNLKRTGRPIAERWINDGWRRPVLPSGLTSWIAAASAASAKNVWAVSHLGGYVLDWVDGTWTQAPGWTPQPGRQLTGITAFTKNNVWVFGASSGANAGAGTWHYSGGTWKPVTGVASDIYRASDLGPASIWAIGGIGGSRNAVEHYDGLNWAQVTGKALRGMRFNAVLALTPDSVWVAGRARQHGRLKPKLAHFNGRQWVLIAVPGRAIPSQISSDGHGGIWVAANSAAGSWMRHRSQHGRWRSTKIGTGPANQINAIAHIPGTTSLWAGGRTEAGTGTNAAIYSHGRIG